MRTVEHFFERRVVSFFLQLQKQETKKRVNLTSIKLTLYSKLGLGNGYLPRQSSAKYFHCYESLRPCSGWERVVSSRLVTEKLAVQLSEFIYSSSFSVPWKLHNKRIFCNHLCFWLLRLIEFGSHTFAITLRKIQFCLCNQRLLRQW